MPPAGYEPPSPSKRVAADALDHEVTGIGIREITDTNILCS